MTTARTEAALAMRARTALAHARQVTLLVDGLGDAVGADAEIVLYDRDGCPTFLCGPGSAVPDAAAQRRPAQVFVEGRNSDGERWTVRLQGRLVRGGVEHVDGITVDVVGLRPESVHVGAANGDGHDVPLELYRTAEVDPLACCADRILTHTNASHPRELRDTAARFAGLHADAIAAASLTDLDRDGVTLHWVTTDGAHSGRMHFAEPATGPNDLARTLRGALTGP